MLTFSCCGDFASFLFSFILSEGWQLGSINIHGASLYQSFAKFIVPCCKACKAFLEFSEILSDFEY